VTVHQLSARGAAHLTAALLATPWPATATIGSVIPNNEALAPATFVTLGAPTPMAPTTRPDDVSALTSSGHTLGRHRATLYAGAVAVLTDGVALTSAPRPSTGRCSGSRTGCSTIAGSTSCSAC
jgi:hypothetical protein